MSIFKDAASLAKALAIQIAAGFPIASKEEQEERHKICQSCDELNTEEYRCKICNCYIQIKASLGTSKCPLNKWPDLMNKENNNENK